jgi:biotin carboxylase
MSRVLVTDAEQRSALAIVRSLGRAGHTVYVCSARRRSLAGDSRYAAAGAVVPDALRDPVGYAEQVRALLVRWRIDVLLPVAEPALLALLPEGAVSPGVAVPFPSLEVFARMADKAAVLAAARGLRIAVPEQAVLTAPEDLEAQQGRDMRFPLVIKPARSVGEVAGERGKYSVQHAADAAQLRQRVMSYPRAAFPLLLQRRIVGPGVGVFALIWDRKPLAVFAHRRIREKPPSGGVSVYRESVPVAPGLLERALALLDDLSWQGVAMVEFKVDAESGTPYLMEVNGRFWGSLQLAIDAGVDFPTLLLQAAEGRAAPPVVQYREGVRSRWWWGDVDHLLARLRRSRAALDLPPDAPGRWAAIRDFLRVRPGVDRNEILRWDDPRPFLRESLEWIRNR